MTPSAALYRSLPQLQDVLPVSEKPFAYKRKAVLYTEGAPGIFAVHSGVVRVFRTTEEGDPVHVDFYGPGDFFGLSCFEPIRRHEGAVAHSACVVSTWRADAVMELLVASPDAARAFLRAAVEQNARLYSRVLRAERLLCREAVEAALVDLEERIGVSQDGGITASIQPCVTHDVIAQSIGTSREVVTCHLNRIRDAGFVEFSRGELLIRAGALKGVLAAKAAA